MMRETETISRQKRHSCKMQHDMVVNLNGDAHDVV